MDFSRVKSITISHLDFQEIINGTTGNPIAESDVPELLRQAVRSGARVLITDPFGKASCQLVLDQSGQFKYVPLV